MEPSTPTLPFTGWVCPECGYDLRGLRDPRCPECGQAFDPATFEANTRRKRRHYVWRMLALGLLIWLAGLGVGLVFLWHDGRQVTWRDVLIVTFVAPVMLTAIAPLMVLVPLLAAALIALGLTKSTRWGWALAGFLIFAVDWAILMWAVLHID